MKINSKTAQKAWNEYKKEYEELKPKCDELERQRDAAHDAWYNCKRDCQNSHELYKEFDKAESRYNECLHRFNFLKLLVENTDKLYANEFWYSDIEPFEVIEMCSRTKFLVRKMKAVEKKDAQKKRAESFTPGGFFGHFDNSAQDWDITPDENEIIRVIRLTKRLHLHEKGNSNRFRFASSPRKFYDFNF